MGEDSSVRSRGEHRGSSYPERLVRFTLFAGVPSVVPFGPVMRMVWSRKASLARSFVRPWLMRRKQAGKICRLALLLPLSVTAAQSGM